MSTETISDRGEHVRSIGVTAFSALLGVVAALASSVVTADAESLDAAAGDPLALAIVAAAILIQFPLIEALGIYDEDEFGIKHYLFITFMTFSFWFVVWGIMLTADATIV